jgi:hypothetical protein
MNNLETTNPKYGLFQRVTADNKFLTPNPKPSGSAGHTTAGPNGCRSLSFSTTWTEKSAVPSEVRMREALLNCPDSVLDTTSRCLFANFSILVRPVEGEGRTSKN